MKKILSIIFMGVAAFTMTSCFNDFDDADTSNFSVTATSIGEPNTTIYDIKNMYCSNSTKAGTNVNSSNFWSLISEDLIFEGVVVGNDISGNLYQQVYLRDFGTGGKAEGKTDQCIQLGIKNPCLHPYFRLGQKVRVNLKGLYVGVYSKTPKVGTPYFTSSGNNRLGPMLFDLLKTNVQLIGEPDPNAPELVPMDKTTATGLNWIKANSNQTWENSPILATVEGKIKEVQGGAAKAAEAGTQDSWNGVYESIITYYENGEKCYSKMYAPECLRDAGYAVDRTIQCSNGSTVTLRTGTGNDISFLTIPKDSRKYTGIMSYYSGWQMQLRDTKDIYPQIDPKLGTDSDENK